MCFDLSSALRPSLFVRLLKMPYKEMMDHRSSEPQDALVRVLCRPPFAVERYEEDTEGERDVMGTGRDCLKDEEPFRGTTRVPGTEEGRE